MVQTVSELIENLKDLPPDYEIYVVHPDGEEEYFIDALYTLDAKDQAFITTAI